MTEEEGEMEIEPQSGAEAGGQGFGGVGSWQAFLFLLFVVLVFFSLLLSGGFGEKEPQ